MLLFDSVYGFWTNCNRTANVLDLNPCMNFGSISGAIPVPLYWFPCTNSGSTSCAMWTSFYVIACTNSDPISSAIRTSLYLISCINSGSIARGMLTWFHLIPYMSFGWIANAIPTSFYVIASSILGQYPAPSRCSSIWLQLRILGLAFYWIASTNWRPALSIPGTNTHNPDIPLSDSKRKFKEWPPRNESVFLWPVTKTLAVTKNISGLAGQSRESEKGN